MKEQDNELIKKLKSLTPKRGTRSWIAQLPQKDQEMLEGFRDYINSGKAPKFTRTQIYNDCIARKYNVSRSCFNSWILNGRKQNDER